MNENFATTPNGYFYSASIGSSLDFKNAMILIQKNLKGERVSDCYEEAFNPEFKSISVSIPVTKYSITPTTISRKITLDQTKNQIASNTYSITELNTLLKLKATNIHCKNDADGSIEAFVENGKAPYNYAWSNGKISNKISQLKPGIYSVTVSDNLFCALSKSIEIKEPALLKIDITKQDVTCNGKADGTASALVSGGTKPYQYYWSNNEKSKTITSLFKGPYLVNVVDSNGCKALNSTIIAEPKPLSSTIAASSILCHGGTSIIITTVSNGTKPYSYMWNNDSTTSFIKMATAGHYVVTITDACNDSVENEISIDQPNKLKSETVAKSIVCHLQENGSVAVVASEGTAPYTYKWSNGETTRLLLNLKSNNYYVTITDACNDTKVDSAQVADVEPLSHIIITKDAKCYGDGNGSVGVRPQGGTAPYSVVWNFGVNADTISNLFPGTYTFNVYDSKGCSAPGKVEIYQPQKLSIELFAGKTLCNKNEGKILSLVQGGTTPYTYLWSNGKSNENIDSLQYGNYSVTVTDYNNCSTTNSAKIDVYVKQYPICMLSVDSASKGVKVIWEKDGDASIDSFNIYCWYGKYKKVGKISADTFSVFNDYTSRPNQASYQYAISSKDKCGNESELSQSHASLHVYSMPSTEPNKAIVEWTPYFDESNQLVPDMYYVYKGNSYKQMTLFDSVPGNNTSYTDTANNGARYYRVSFKKPQECIVTKTKTDSGPFSLSLSNLAESELTKQEELTQKNVKVWPNITKSNINVDINNIKNEYSIKIADLLQKEILSKKVSGSKIHTSFDLTGFAPGLYFVTISSNNSTITRKIILE